MAVMSGLKYPTLLRNIILVCLIGILSILIAKGYLFIRGSESLLCPTYRPSRNDFGNLVQIGATLYKEELGARRELTDADIGLPIGQVRCTIADTDFDWKSPWPDGYATFLPIGTQMFAVDGYAPAFRLAERSSGRWRIYDALVVPNARLGADLFDFHGNVQAIDIHIMMSDSNFAGQRITQPNQIEDIIRSILTAPIDPTRADVGSMTARITFRFRDDTTSTQMYFPESATLGRGLILPLEVRATFDRAIRDQRNTPHLFFPIQQPFPISRDELITGQLIYQDGCLRLVTPKQSWLIIWPSAFQYALIEQQVVVLDPKGVLFAAEGLPLTVRGVPLQSGAIPDDSDIPCMGPYWHITVGPY